MTTAADVLHVAQSQVGYIEGGGSTGHNGNITKYWQELELDLQGQSWCAAFVSWVFKHAGAPLPAIDHKWGFSYCPDAVNYAKKHGLWDASGHYSPGDVVLYCWDGSGVAEHVGIVVSDDGTNIHVIEGNTSPGTAGSQSNGGGVYARVRPHGPTVLGVLKASKLLSTTPAPTPAPAKPAPAPAPAKSTDLGPGSKGTAVRQWQVNLNGHFHTRLVADGDFGPATEVATKQVQSKLHVPTTGKVDAATRKAVSGYLNAKLPVLKVGSSGALVREVQQAVGATVDGIFGPGTRDKVKAFQAHHGLTADGQVGPKTWAVIR